MKKILFIFIAFVTCETNANIKMPLIFNEDNDRFFIYSKPEDISEQGLREYINQLKGGNVTHFFMCPNGQRTSFKSKAHEAIWECAPDAPHRCIWCDNAKKLHDNGIDPYAVWIDECRKQNISPWITMRMNDVHFAPIKGYFRNMDFWRNNRQLWRNPNTSSSENWTEYAFDYSKKEVRDFQFSLIEELFERYDFDGFELDWMRFPAHLTPQKGREQAYILTEFMHKVRAVADKWENKRNHKIKISVRVPATIENSNFLGLDAVSWANLGYVDIIVPSNFYHTIDFDMPIDKWKDAVSKTSVKIIPSCDNGVQCSSKATRSPTSLPIIRGWATNCYARGADGLYLFNIAYSPDMQKEIALQGLTPKLASDNQRRHLLTFHDYLEYESIADKKESLPAKTPCSLKVFIGSKPQNNNKIFVVIGSTSAPKNIQLKLNGKDATKIEKAPLSKDKYGNANFINCFEINHQNVKANYNEIFITTDSPVDIMWCEIDIQNNQK